MRDGWEIKKLGDLCEFQRGLTYTKTDEVEISDNIVLRATNIDLSTNLLNLSELKYISDRVAVPDSKKVSKNSMMICTASGSKSHLGKVAYIDDDYGYAFGGFMGMITPKSALLPRYLFHLMTSDAYKDFIGKVSDGANINNLKFDDLRGFLVPLPSISEQQRIVSILDQVFEGIATAKANAENNLKNARQLFESHLNSVFSQRGEGWVEKTIEELIETNCIGLTKSSREQGPEKKWRYVKMHNITRDNRLDFSNYVRVDANDAEICKFQLKDGDFLFNTRNSFELVGKVCLFENNLNDIVLFNNNIMRIRYKSGVEGRFILFAFSSKSIAEALTAMKSGTTNVSAIYYKDLRLLKIAIPPVDVQRKITRHLTALHVETQRLESIYQKKIEALDALKKSILQKAFSGKM